MVRRGRWFSIVALLGLLAPLAGCSEPSSIAAAPESTPQSPPGVRVATSPQPRSVPAPDVGVGRPSTVGTIAVAVSERTVAGQAAPAEAIAQLRNELGRWCGKETDLVEMVADPIDADWLVQLAAVERPELVYLAATPRFMGDSGEQAVVMSPAGTSDLTAWIETELETIAKSHNLLSFAQKCSQQKPDLPLVEITLRRMTNANAEKLLGEPLKAGPDLTLRSGEMVGLQARNCIMPVALKVLFIDSDYHLHELQPEPDQSVSLTPGGCFQDRNEQIIINGLIDSNRPGIEHFIVIATQCLGDNGPAPLPFTISSSRNPLRGNQTPYRQLVPTLCSADARRTLATSSFLKDHAVFVFSWHTAGVEASETDLVRGFLGIFRQGSADDLKAEIVEEQSGSYHTVNRTQAVLGTYGKFIKSNKAMGRLARFEHRGVIESINGARKFVTVQRRGKGAGKDFVSFMGGTHAWQVAELSGQVSAGKKDSIEFEMIGSRLDQNDVVRALNADREAIGYFTYLKQHDQIPCMILENVLLTRYSAERETKLNVEGKANVAVLPDSVQGKVDHERSAYSQLTSPVVRCYQMYAVKMQGDRVMELVCIEP